jgi:hypothetical protein
MKTISKYGSIKNRILKTCSKLLETAWLSNKIPTEWTTTIQVPLPKKKNPKNTDDYRRISLTSTGYKIYVNWLSTKLINMLEELPLYQTGLMKNRSYDDHIFTIRRILDENWRHGKTLYITFIFIDLKKTFDSIDTSKLDEILTNKNIPHHLINRIIEACINENINKIDTTNTKIHWNKTRLSAISISFQHHTA